MGKQDLNLEDRQLVRREKGGVRAGEEGKLVS